MSRNSTKTGFHQEQNTLDRDTVPQQVNLIDIYHFTIFFHSIFGKISGRLSKKSYCWLAFAVGDFAILAERGDRQRLSPLFHGAMMLGHENLMWSIGKWSVGMRFLWMKRWVPFSQSNGFGWRGGWGVSHQNTSFSKKDEVISISTIIFLSINEDEVLPTQQPAGMDIWDVDSTLWRERNSCCFPLQWILLQLWYDDNIYDTSRFQRYAGFLTVGKDCFPLKFHHWNTWTLETRAGFCVKGPPKYHWSGATS